MRKLLKKVLLCSLLLAFILSFASQNIVLANDSDINARNQQENTCGVDLKKA